MKQLIQDTILKPRRFGQSTFVTNSFLASCKSGKSAEYHSMGWIALSDKAHKDMIQRVRREEWETIKAEILYWCQENAFTYYDKNDDINPTKPIMAIEFDELEKFIDSLDPVPVSNLKSK